MNCSDGSREQQKRSGGGSSEQTEETYGRRGASTTDIGGAFWPIEGSEFVPLVEPFDVTFWVDWISAQQCTACLRCLIQEVNLRSGGRIQVDP